MCKTVKAAVVGLVVLSLWQVMGCAPPTIPVPVAVGGTAVGEYTLEGGVAKRQSISINFDSPVTIGTGSFALDPSKIQVVSANTGGGKQRVAAQVQSCSEQVEADGLFDACVAGGSTEEDCSEQVRQAILDCLGDGSTLEITAWIGSPAQLDTIFETGDRYGTYRVTLNEAGQGVSVSPSSIQLADRTIGLLNAGQFSIGFELIFGENATVVVDSFTLNLGL